jgi:hypothetical protein
VICDELVQRELTFCLRQHPKVKPLADGAQSDPNFISFSKVEVPPWPSLPLSHAALATAWRALVVSKYLMVALVVSSFPLVALVVSSFCLVALVVSSFPLLALVLSSFPLVALVVSFFLLMSSARSAKLPEGAACTVVASWAAAALTVEQSPPEPHRERRPPLGLSVHKSS